MAMIEILKLKASKYYQDEMEVLMRGKLFIEDRQLNEFHTQISDNTIKKFRNEFQMLTENTYLQTLRQCIKVVFDKVVQNNSLYRPKKTHAIGIDLGTTNSCVSYFKPSAENKFNCVIVPNEFGRNTTASVFSIREDEEEVIGDVAKEEIYAYPKSTITSAKRLIGRKFNDESVQKSLKLWSYEVTDDGNNNPNIKLDEYLRIRINGVKHLSQFNSLAYAKHWIDVEKHQRVDDPSKSIDKLEALPFEELDYVYYDGSVIF